MGRELNTKPRILLVGYTGQVGMESTQRLAELGDVAVTDVKAAVAVAGKPASAQDAFDLDLSDFAAIARVVREVKPHLIVNAAAYTAVDKAETDRELAWAVNALAPGVLAKEAAKLGAAIVHYSTDYVFDGSGTTPRSEDAPTGPLNYYGESKLGGEREVSASGAAYFTFRTSWVVSRHGHNFVKTMLKLGSEREALKVVEDQIGAPTTAAVIAGVTCEILAKSRDLAMAEWVRKHQGIYHLTCQGETNWAAFAREIFRLGIEAGMQLKVKSVEGISTEAYPTPAKRPKNSRLDCARLINTFGVRLPAWDMALRKVIEEVDSSRA